MTDNEKIALDLRNDLKEIYGFTDEELAGDMTEIKGTTEELTHQISMVSLPAAEYAQLKADAERLDYVQSITKGYGKGWVLRNSNTGRGMRLHETGEPTGNPSVREAIDKARGK